MFQDNPLLAQLKQQIKENIPKKEGTIKATEKGFGFLEVDSKTSYFIPPVYMKKVMHGDKVVALIRTEKEKEVAEPDELIEQNLHRFIGRVKMIRDRVNVVPDNPQIKDAIRAKSVKGLPLSELKEGDWVVATLFQHPLTNDKGFFCEISKKITDADDKIAPWWVTLAKHDLPNQEPLPQDSWSMIDEALERTDLTDVPFVTIDSASTKDMDDALHAVRNEDGTFTLTIAIADPTAYVEANTALDKEARERGFTIYLPGRNIPMLPRELSDNLCSLIEDEIRPAICCRVIVQPDGTLSPNPEFFAASIKSHARLAYDNVSDYLEQGECAQWAPSEIIADQVQTLYKLAKSRINWRETHAVTFQDRPDYRFELNSDNDVVAIHTDSRRIANRIVEEAMITANICAGNILNQHFQAGIFNSHIGFNAEKIEDIVALANEHGADTSAEALLTLEGFSALRRWLNQQETTYLDNRIRKYQSYSEIGVDPAPHFAMGLETYATWTSPIRKYGDMVNHRLLKAIILGKPDVEKPDSAISEQLASHRRLHRMAERDVADWLYARFLDKDVAEKTVFNAEIFDINRAGMRVRLLDNGAMAFVPAPVILDNKERIECNQELGQIMVDGVVEFQLGDIVDVNIIDIKQTTRSIIGKPTREFAVVAEKAE